jgi:hypothetical protein
MTLAQYAPTEGSKTYVTGDRPATAGAPAVLTVADVMAEHAHAALLGLDASRSDSRESVVADETLAR